MRLPPETFARLILTAVKDFGDDPDALGRVVWLTVATVAALDGHFESPGHAGEFSYHRAADFMGCLDNQLTVTERQEVAYQLSKLHGRAETMKTLAELVETLEYSMIEKESEETQDED